MWLITDTGFYSIVEKPGDAKAGVLTVRSRQRADLEALRRRHLPSLRKITESRATDYRYRARAPRADVAAAMARVVESIGYSNFKDHVRKAQGTARERVYHDVWHALYELQHQ